MKRAKGLRLAALALGGAVLLSGCVTRTEPSVSTQIFVMDTIMSLELWEGGQSGAAESGGGAAVPMGGPVVGHR